MQRERFLEFFDGALAAEGFSMTRPDPADPLSGTIESDTTVTLAHVFKTCAEVSDSEAMQEIAKFVACLKLAVSDDKFPKRWDDVRANLLPILRDKASLHISSLAHSARQADDTESLPPHIEVGHDLIALVAIDSETAIITPPADEFEQWGKGFEQAFEVALANLAKRATGPHEETGNGLYAWCNGNDYESSRLLLPSFLDDLPNLAGDPVVLCPAKDAVLVAGSHDPDGLSEMAHEAAAIIEDCRPLTGLAMVRRDGAWHRFPEAGDAGADDLRSLRRYWMDLTYNEQKEFLDNILKLQSKDIVVAPYRTIPQNPQFAGLVDELSYATWVESVDSWLPEVEHVFFGHSSDEISFAPWDTVRAVLGARMSPTHHYPPRYEVRGFPTAEDFASMGAKPVKRKETKKGIRALLPW